MVKIFISGGCKNGKSAYAQKLALALRRPGTPLYYAATMISADSEDDARIKRHRGDRRGLGFETIEAGRDIPEALSACDWRGTFLLDSVTALLANEMFTQDNAVRPDAYMKVAGDLTGLAGRAGNIVIVSDYIYSDACLYDDLTEAYRIGLAYVDRQLAAISDVVLEICGGIYITHKGGHVLKELLYGLG